MSQVSWHSVDPYAGCVAFFAKKRKGRRAERERVQAERERAKAERERAKAERERAKAERAEAERVMWDIAKAERAKAERERAKAEREATARRLQTQAEREAQSRSEAAQSRSEAAEEAQRSIERLFMDNEVAAIRALPSQQLVAAVAKRRAALKLPPRWSTSRGWRGLFTYDNAEAIERGASPEQFIRLVAHQARARTHQY